MVSCRPWAVSRQPRHPGQDPCYTVIRMSPAMACTVQTLCLQAFGTVTRPVHDLLPLVAVSRQPGRPGRASLSLIVTQTFTVRSRPRVATVRSLASPMTGKAEQAGRAWPRLGTAHSVHRLGARATSQDYYNIIDTGRQEPKLVENTVISSFGCRDTLSAPITFRAFSVSQVPHQSDCM